MGTIEDKLRHSLECKEAIKQAITDKGVDVGDAEALALYPDKIGKIKQGEIEQKYTDLGFGYAIEDDGVLIRLAENDYEITKNWTDYSMARDNRVIKFIPFLDTSSVTTMAYLFSNCTSLSGIPLIDTSSVTTMANIFNGCTSLLFIPPLDTSNVTSMEQSYVRCSSLRTISILDAPMNTYMYAIFLDCTSLISIQKINAINVYNIQNAFYNCTSLVSISLLIVSKLRVVTHMFYNCKSLTTLNIEGVIDVTNIDLTSSPLLTVKSLMSVINVLADRTTTTPYNLRFGAINLAKLTPEQIAIATDKNWTLV